MKKLSFPFRPSFLAPFVLGLALLSGCVAREIDDRPQGPILVKVPLLVGDAEAGQGSYQMQTVQVDTVENLQFFSGQSARFYYSPGNVGEQIVGIQPIVKLGRDGDGVYFPLDTISMQIVTIYYQLEQLRKFDIELGQVDQSPWPRQVAIEARINNQDNDRRHNNAFYSPALKAMIFVPYKLGNLPIQVNAGVVAHEHFHALFDRIVEQPLKEKKFIDEKNEIASQLCKGEAGQSLYRLTLLRALNEGLADLWAWTYTGDTRFVGRSLGTKKFRPSSDKQDRQSGGLCSKELPPADRRDLNAPVGGMIESCECIHERITALSERDLTLKQNQEKVVGVSYFVGARVARLIKQFVASGEGRIQPKSFEDRKRLGAAIVAGLKRIEGRLASMKADEWIEPAELVAEITDEMAALNQSNCDLVRRKLGKAVKGRCAEVQVPPTSERGPSSESRVDTQSSLKKVSRFRTAFLLNSDLRYELNEAQEMEKRQLFGLGLGLRKGKWMGLIEGSRSSSSSQLGNISVNRTQEQIGFSGILFAATKNFDPYISAGVAFLRDKADYSVDGSDSESRGVWEPTNLFSAGIRFLPEKPVWISAEGRVLVGGRIETDPTFGFTVRLGFEL